MSLPLISAGAVREEGSVGSPSGRAGPVLIEHWPLFCSPAVFPPRIRALVWVRRLVRPGFGLGLFVFVYLPLFREDFSKLTQNAT